MHLENLWKNSISAFVKKMDTPDLVQIVTQDEKQVLFECVQDDLRLGPSDTAQRAVQVVVQKLQNTVNEETPTKE